MKTIDELKSLEQILGNDIIPKARRSWGGADVVISRNAPTRQANDFYPDPRYVVTRYDREVSWLFEKLRDAFYAENRLDSCSKIEFFGRLANAANRCIRQDNSHDAFMVCSEVLSEAIAIYNEMESGRFGCLPIASGSEILDDYEMR